ncbi:MAG: ABC transporter ATP-binding protein [Balneolaceae bacterium]|jgi:lipoprotein-releasing system ATP-binding protein|nr:MAG: ABC transporter ATP-binding protein [Balneolaceae bacterium]
MDTLLQAVNLIKDYKSKDGISTLRVLDGVDISITRGSIVSITGASGSGKSTLLHILGGLDRPTIGDVLFRQTNLNDLSDDNLAGFRNKNLGFIFQFHHLLPEFTAIENVMMPGLIGGGSLDELRGKALELLRKFSLDNRQDHRPSELSGGEQQRVAAARALMNDPDLILADEPTGNLDDKNTEGMLDLLFSLRDQDGMTLVMVTHDLKIADRCDEQFVLHKGQLRSNE